MNIIKKNLHYIHNKINKLAKKYNRNPSNIQLIAVTKNQSIHLIQDAIKYNQYSFGENYVQEAIKKINSLSKNYNYLNWHFIGKLQSNKTRFVAENFSWCHTIDRLSIAKRLNEQIPKNKAKINVLIQINISNSDNRAGVILKELEGLSKAISVLPNLIFRGIMVFPSKINNDLYAIKIYKQIANLFNFLKTQYDTVDTLSLGTSNDLEISIAYGSTMLRIGNAIFNKN